MVRLEEASIERLQIGEEPLSGEETTGTRVPIAACESAGAVSAFVAVSALGEAGQRERMTVGEAVEGLEPLSHPRVQRQVGHPLALEVEDVFELLNALI